MSTCRAALLLRVAAANNDVVQIKDREKEEENEREREMCLCVSKERSIDPLSMKTDSISKRKQLLEARFSDAYQSFIVDVVQ